MQALIGYRVKVTLNDSRSLIGQMLAFDAKFNLVLADCEEYRRVKHKKSSSSSGNKGAKQQDDDDDDDDNEEEMKRMLGLVILRGETVVTLTVEGPPPVADDAKGPSVSNTEREDEYSRSLPSFLDSVLDTERLHLSLSTSLLDQYGTWNGCTSWTWNGSRTTDNVSTSHGGIS